MTTALNHVGGGWQRSGGADLLDVHNPASAAAIGRVVLSSANDLDAAVEAATAAAREWRNTPVEDRIQPLFRLKALMDERVDELARIITEENGKTLAESVGELKRAIENVEVACGTPTLMQGDFLEDVASGIDELMVRQPVGVCAIVCPFNFPAMIPFWFFPYAVACGNTCIIKPSERTPLTMRAVFELLEEAGFPPGVANLVNGDRGVVDAILEHPGIRAVSFVGSTPVAKHVYATASAAGKRVQAQGRRQESDRRASGRRHRRDVHDRGGQRLRLRRAALPSRLAGDHGGRCGRSVRRRDGADRQLARGRQRPGRRR